MTWPKGGPTRDQAAADALDRYWDSLMTTHPGGASRPDELLEPGLTRIVRQLRYTDQTPRLEPAFASRLWGDLSAGRPASPAVASASDGAKPGSVWPRHRFLVELAVAATLLVAVLGGGMALKLPVSLAPVMAPTAAASPGEPDAGARGGHAACAPTVTPEPARATIRPEPTTPPLPTVPAGPGAPC